MTYIFVGIAIGLAVAAFLGLWYAETLLRRFDMKCRFCQTGIIATPDKEGNTE